MGHTISIDSKGTHLHVCITGQNTPDNVRAYLKEVYEACGRTGVSSVLIEEDLEGPPLDPLDV